MVTRMERPIRLRTVAVLSIVFTYFFFIEYLPPFSRVHVPYDLEGYHFSLSTSHFNRCAKDASRNGTGHSTAALALSEHSGGAVLTRHVARPRGERRRKSLSYQSLQSWCLRTCGSPSSFATAGCDTSGWGSWRVLWARGVRYSGYMLLQLQHFGLVAGCAWMPLGLWVSTRPSRSGAGSRCGGGGASALCFLAGYPPTCSCLPCAWSAMPRGDGSSRGHDPGSGRIPGHRHDPDSAHLEALSLKAPEIKYGSGIRALDFYNFVSCAELLQFRIACARGHEPGREYLYLGAPAIFGLLCLARRRGWRDVMPLLAMGGVTAVVVTNPFGLVWQIVRHSTLLVQICRDGTSLRG